MDKDMAKKNEEDVKKRVKLDRVAKIIADLYDHKLLPEARIEAIEGDMVNWNNEQLEAMERFIDVSNANSKMKADLQKANLELQSDRVLEDLNTKEGRTDAVQKRHDIAMKDIGDMVEHGQKIKEIVGGTIEEEKPEQTNSEAVKLASAMLRAGLINASSYDTQVSEIMNWNEDVLKAMWKMVDEASKPFGEPKVEARKWGVGSDIAKANKERKHEQFNSYVDAAKKAQIDSIEKEIVIDKPTVRKSIKETVTEAQEKKTHPISKPYVNRGSIKDRKEESDRKTTEEPRFIAEIREAREFLERFDETFASAKVAAIKAKEAMLQEEQKYNGTKIHSDTKNLHKLIKEHIKAQRNFAIIDKVYKQAFSRFKKVDVEQVSVQDIEEALKNYQAGDTQSDLVSLFGGKYRTGDESYYKWLARKRKLYSEKQAADLVESVINLSEDVADKFMKGKAVGLARHTQDESELLDAMPDDK